MIQIPIDYSRLTITQEHKIHRRDILSGMCYSNGRLYITEGWQPDRQIHLVVYSVIHKDTFTQLDALRLEGSGWEPRVDHNSGWVYIPGGIFGVYVIRYDGSKLVRVAKLKCVRDARSVAVASTGRLYVCDRETKSICQVDVSRDMVTARLNTPPGMGSIYGMAILGDTGIGVCDVFSNAKPLRLFSHTGMCSVPSPGKLLPWPKELESVYCLTTDHHSSFLLTGFRSTVYVMDVNRNLTHTLTIPGDRRLRDCTVMLGQLWVGCTNGDIIVMSPH